MPRPTSVTLSSVSSSAPIPINWRAENFGVGLGCTMSGTLTYRVQHTFDDVFDPAVTPVWFTHATLTGQTANADGNYAFPVRAIRLDVTAYTSGSVTLTIIQGGY